MTSRFHERFHIELDDKQARRRFVNRAYNIILNCLDDVLIVNDRDQIEEIQKFIVTAIGEFYDEDMDLVDQIGHEY